MEINNGCLAEPDIRCHNELSRKTGQRLFLYKLVALLLIGITDAPQLFFDLRPAHIQIVTQSLQTGIVVAKL